MPTFTRHEGGWGWAYLPDGRVVCEHKPQSAANLVFETIKFGGVDAYVYRTNGEPKSMFTTLETYWNDIAEACEEFELDPFDIAAVIGIEAVRMPNKVFDPTSCREESGFVSDSETPHRVSSGLMQTLLSTFSDVEREIPMQALGKDVDRYDLFSTRRSILGGSAYMRRQLDKHGDRVKAFVAAYNAGGVYSDNNVWNLRTYSNTRIDRWCAWVNDAIEVLEWNQF